MTTGEVVAQFERSQAELREATRTLERMTAANEAATRAILNPPPPPPPPASPAAPWPSGPRAPGLSPAQLQQVARNARQREMTEWFHRQEQERAIAAGRLPRAPAVHRPR